MWNYVIDQLVLNVLNLKGKKMSVKFRKCPFCSTKNSSEEANCVSCHKYLIDINKNKDDDLYALCKSIIDEKFLSPSSEPFIVKHFDKIAINDNYYDEYLQSKCTEARRQIRAKGVKKIAIGIVLAVLAIYQLTLAIIWYLPFGLCVGGALGFLTLGIRSLVLGKN